MLSEDGAPIEERVSQRLEQLHLAPTWMEVNGGRIGTLDASDRGRLDLHHTVDQSLHNYVKRVASEGAAARGWPRRRHDNDAKAEV